MTTGIARDLSGKLQAKLAEVLERELQIYQHVLEPTQIGEVMFEAAGMTVRTTAATLAAYADKPEDITAIFRSVTAGILESVRCGEADGIVRAIKAIEARRR